MHTSQTHDLKGIATIAISARIFVQGVFVRRLDEGRVVVRVDNEDFAGIPLTKTVA